MDTEHLHAEIIGELEKKAEAERAEKEMYYHKKVGESFKCYGISSSDFAEIAKKYRQAFKELSSKERIELARRLFRSGYAGQMSFGIALMKLNVKEMKPTDFRFLEEVADCFNNARA
jgi:hypothetical protein